MEITIRCATIEDAHGIARVRVITWQDAYQGIIPQAHLDALDIEQQTIRWRAGLTNLLPGSRIFVAEVAAQGEAGREGERSVVGFCACGPERGQDAQYTGEIYALYVLPECHRQGVGKRMVQEAAKFLSEQEHPRVIIYVLLDNLPSRAFYEAIGGTAAREKVVEIGGKMLAEVGYGYATEKLLENS